ncbi:MAG TPA: tRNA pseudouridine(38-40) synthase TruA [Clostridia bacterium]|nr:MAG: tRNA pseudouridine synthase A [Firmicutes bacterium ADurb.Bin356]HOR12453.1 tRNA pseudouridine(38-40) synthase TruA [Clostridia bacterium]
MRRIRLILEYNGAAYAGWQVQQNGVSIQGLLEKELNKITGAATKLTGSGRTDSGVHALAQVAHFDTESRMEAGKFAFALNAGLPRDIRVRYSDETDMNFHARYGAYMKHYRYALYTGPHSRAFLRDTALHVHAKLDEEKLQSAAAKLIGTHDFRAFMAAGGRVKSTVREIYSSAWSSCGSLLYYDIEGNGFLYNMVRIIVGTMLEIAKGAIFGDAFLTAFKTGSRQALGATAPAHGLTLVRVCYEGFDTAKVLGEL